MKRCPWTEDTTPDTPCFFPNPGWFRTSSAASCRRSGSAGSTPPPSNAGTAGPVPRGAGEENLVALLCEFERSRSAEAVDPLLARLAELLVDADDEPLRRAWSIFLGCSFLPRRFPDLFAAAMPGGVLA